MSNGYWKDDGDGQSFTLWDSKEDYDRDSADMMGQIDFRTHPQSFRKLWRAIAYKGENMVVGWLNSQEKAITFVDRELTV